MKLSLHSNRTTLEEFHIDEDRGFLPRVDPLLRLPRQYDAWEQISTELPKLLVSNKLQLAVDQLPVINSAELVQSDQLERAMLLLSYLGHAYVFGGLFPSNHIPPSIAIPWVQTAIKLRRPPVLSYASHALSNWRRFDRNASIALDNIARLQNFYGGVDEDWFVLIHIAIEAAAAPALVAALKISSVIRECDVEGAITALDAISNSLADMLFILKRMPDKCEPYIYYTRVRQFIFGWMDNPALPNGIIYTGAPEYSDQPQKFRGETGAQSSIIPALDAICGIKFVDSPLDHHLKDLRRYMPAGHRQFIDYLENNANIRPFVISLKYKPLSESYNKCIEAIGAFRSQHLEYAGIYIHSQSQRANSNPTSVGTGGTPFMQYLKAHSRESDQYKV